MRQRFANFMLGRNGTDAFNRFLLIAGAALLLLGSILSRQLRYSGSISMSVTPSSRPLF